MEPANELVITPFMEAWGKICFTDEIVEWCRDNCAGRVTKLYPEGNADYVLAFERSADAVLFKLRWF